MAVNSEIASMILQDIHRKRLVPGDPYLPAREVAKQLGVSTMTANRALQQLSAQGILVRKRRTGTIIGPKADEEGNSPLRYIQLLFCASYPLYPKAWSLLDDFVEGLESEFSHDGVQFTYAPPHREMRAVRTVIEQMVAAGILDGVVLVRSTPAIQKYFASSAVPTVVWGSVYPRVAGLPWLDLDWRASGKLLIEHLVGRGHHRIGLIMRDEWASGDNLLFEGVQAALAAYDLGQSGLILRSVQSERAVLSHTVQDLLAHSNQPTALICRTAAMGQTVLQTISEMGLKPGRDISVVAADSVSLRDNTGLVHVTAACEGIEQGRIVGRMLAQLAEGKHPNPNHYLVPVQLSLDGVAMDGL